MDLSHIGAHCAVSSCNVRDFLPIYCECQQKFCSDHISPELHNCSSLKANTEELKTFSDKIQRCSVADCGKPSLNGINGATGETCSACHAALCVAHRHPDAHACSAAITPPVSSSPAKSVKPVNEATKSYRKRRPPTDPVKLAQWQRLELLKMQHTAVPVDVKDKNTNIPPDQRVHAIVMEDDLEKVFWFRKTLIAGRALDMLCQQLGIKNPQNLPLILTKTATQGGDASPLKNDVPLADQIENGCILQIQRNIQDRK